MRAPGSSELWFVPLGGSGEIGMNLNLYGHDGRWLMVDCGIGFCREQGDATRVIMANPRFIERRRDRLEGLVITHAHEDHLGAVPYLWERLRCPIYATAFAAAVLRRKLAEADLDEVPVHLVDRRAGLELGPFSVEFIDVTHSTVESQALLVTTKLGTVLHTGDFKLDDQPLIGPTTDFDALRRAGDRGLLAAVSDSTNATKADASRSEGELRTDLLTRLDDLGDRRIAVASFSSNIARLQTFIDIAARLDRHPVFVGRSLHRMLAAARECGHLGPIPAEIEARDFAYLPPGKTLLICTGTQGEPGSAIDRMARDDHRDVCVESGDLVLFSSKIIPGNEDIIARLHASLRARGCRVVSELEAFVHVSGHPGQPELRELYELARPQAVIPVHGEARHLTAHAGLARSMGMASLVPSNGAIVRLAPGPPVILDRVEHGRLRVSRGRKTQRVR